MWARVLLNTCHLNKMFSLSDLQQNNILHPPPSKQKELIKKIMSTFLICDAKIQIQDLVFDLQVDKGQEKYNWTLPGLSGKQEHLHGLVSRYGSHLVQTCAHIYLHCMINASKIKARSRIFYNFFKSCSCHLKAVFFADLKEL